MKDFEIDVTSLRVGPRLVAARWEQLWMVGAAIALEPPLVALVGTRSPDAQGLRMAHRLAEALALAGITVVSGGALGIDATAHAAAVAAGGRTVVVLPSGLNNPYPMRHRSLYRKIVERGGAVLSPFPPQTPPAHWTFPRRNELLAALSDVLVVVQAPRGSGALLAAEAARTLGRRVLAVPAAPGDSRGAGCVELLRSGAGLCASEEDLLAQVEKPNGPLFSPTFTKTQQNNRQMEGAGKSTLARARARKDESKKPSTSTPDAGDILLDEEGQKILAALRDGPAHPDELSVKTGISAVNVRSSLSMLVLLGAVEERGAGCFGRR